MCVIRHVIMGPGVGRETLRRAADIRGNIISARVAGEEREDRSGPAGASYPLKRESGLNTGGGAEVALP